MDAKCVSGGRLRRGRRRREGMRKGNMYSVDSKVVGDERLGEREEWKGLGERSE